MKRNARKAKGADGTAPNALRRQHKGDQTPNAACSLDLSSSRNELNGFSFP